jgi:ankyrin repeat protein
MHCSLDPTRLLLTFGACTTTQDKLHGNTALHWAILAQNHTAVSTLIMQGASLDITNAQVSICPFNANVYPSGVLSVYSVCLSLRSPIIADSSKFFIRKYNSVFF